MTNIIRSTATLVIFASMAAWSSPASAIVIDTFDTTPSTLSAAGGSAPTGIQDTAAPEAIGGNRALVIDSNPGPAQNFTDFNVLAPAPGILSLSNGFGVSSVSRIFWDAFGAGLNANIIPNGETAFELEVVGIDFGNVDLDIAIQDGGGDLATYLASGLGVGIENIPFANFTNIANVDLTDVDFIQIEIDAGESSDLALDLVGTTTPPGDGTAPEPSSIVMAICGLLGLAMTRRRRRRA